MAARHQEGCHEKNVFVYFYVRERLSHCDVGVAMGTTFQERQPAAGFKTSNFVTGTLGGLYRRTALDAGAVE